MNTPEAFHPVNPTVREAQGIVSSENERLDPDGATVFNWICAEHPTGCTMK